MLSLFGSNDSFKGSFREALGPFLLFGQLFGILPVVGVGNNSMLIPQFKWSSVRAIYSIILSIIFFAYTMTTVWNALVSELQLIEAVASTVFYATNTLTLTFFFALALKWPDLMCFWENAAANLPTFQNKRQQNRFLYEIRFLAFTMLILGAIEHVLYLIPAVQYIMTHNIDDGPITNIVKFLSSNATNDDEFELWDIVCDRLVSFIGTVIWNYADIFIMMVSYGLTTHFKLFNSELGRSRFDNMTPEFWAYRRIQYDRLCNLVAAVDRHISHIILLSFVSNLHVTCKQLYQTFKPFSTTFAVTYHWFSLLFLVLRTFLVAIYAAYIHDESKKPLIILRNLPSFAWCAETKRFYNDITSNITALSGMKFFYLNRKIIISIGATIVTYELLIIQMKVV